MRSRTCSKNRKRNIEVRRSILEEEPQIPGAFIRSFVRQMSSSKTKEPMNSTVPDRKVADRPSKNHTNSYDVEKEAQCQSHPPSKKQVRRRFHTSRPYQERLLNMAEARREIVAALKIHRATMRKASENQQQHSATQQEAASSTPPIETSCLGNKHNTNTSAVITYDPFDNTGFLSSLRPPDFSLSANSISPDSISEDFNLVLPKQPLGLNLTLDGFENLETTFICSTVSNLSASLSSPSAIRTSSSPASSASYSCCPCSTMSATEIPSISPTVVSEATSEPRSESLHPMMDDKEMEEIRLIGEKHDMYWNDKVNTVHSAWWCKFLNMVESDSHSEEESILYDTTDGFRLIEDAMCIPPWLSDQHKMDDFSTDVGCSGHASLPCLDIGFEGIDCEWLL